MKQTLAWHRARPRLGVGLHGALCAFLLGFALISQYVFGLAPCELCIWQRIPYSIILVLAGLSFALDRRYIIFFLLVIAGLYLINAGIAFYHVGVQQGWWVSGCGFQATGGDIQAMYEQIASAPIAKCNEIGWTFIGLSMPQWNMMIAAALSIFALGQAWVQRVWWTDRPAG